MLNEKIFTLDEVAAYLRVPEDAVLQEVASGRLRALSVGGYPRVPQAELVRYIKIDGAAGGSNRTFERDSTQIASFLHSTQNFTHKWPDHSVEDFEDAREGVISYLGRDRHIKIGFTRRESAGKWRRRCLVLVDRYPTVEFAAADETKLGQMASLIRDRSGKQVPVGATLPPEYQGLQVAPYRTVVVGPGASSCVAVVCAANDLDTMVKHALIRCRFREERM
jgi:excisionase family DNA binding protein